MSLTCFDQNTNWTWCKSILFDLVFKGLFTVISFSCLSIENWTNPSVMSSIMFLKSGLEVSF